MLKSTPVLLLSFAALISGKNKQKTSQWRNVSVLETAVYRVLCLRGVPVQTLRAGQRKEGYESHLGEGKVHDPVP